MIRQSVSIKWIKSSIFYDYGIGTYQMKENHNFFMITQSLRIKWNKSEIYYD